MLIRCNLLSPLMQSHTRPILRPTRILPIAIPSPPPMRPRGKFLLLSPPTVNTPPIQLLRPIMRCWKLKELMRSISTDFRGGRPGAAVCFEHHRGERRYWRNRC